MPGMDREEVLAALRSHGRELKAAGIIRLSFFDSTARGDGSPDSDIDLLAAFDSRRLSTLDVVAIQLRLSGLLGRPVDLSEEGTPKPRVQLRVDPEAIRAFWRSGSASRRYPRKYHSNRKIHSGQNLPVPPRLCAPAFPGLQSVALGTFCVMNMTESNGNACGWW
jgi:predicted nucleotidyltransferase